MGLTGAALDPGPCCEEGSRPGNRPNTAGSSKVQEVGALSPAVEARIANYWPKGLATSTPTAELVFVRQVVPEAGPTTSKQAGQALAHTYQLVRWASGAGLPLDRNLFKSKVLDRHAAEHLSKLKGRSGSAARSVLERVGRRSLAPRSSSPQPRLAVVPPIGSRPPTLDVLADFTPRHLAPDRWTRVEPVVAEVVALGEPADARQARAWARPVSYLAAWLDQRHRPVRVDVILAPGTIAEFLSAIDGQVARRSVSSYASILYWLANAHRARLGLDPIASVERRTLGRARRATPASDEMVQRLLTWADRRRGSMKWNARAVILASRGAGAGSRDLLRACCSDVERIDGELVIKLGDPSRTVVVLDRFAEHLEEAATRSAEAGEWLIGNCNDRRLRLANLRNSASLERYDVRLDVAALQLAWRVEVAQILPLAEYLAASGCSSWASLDRVIALLSETAS